MKAHFIASTINLKDDIKVYQLIVKALKDEGVSLTVEWLEAAYARFKKPDFEKTWKDIYRETLDAISKSDIIVAEVSEKSFLVGFQVANALNMKKPILLLSRHKNAEGALGVSLNEDIIKFSYYTEKNVAEHVKDFVKENSAGTKSIRFNFFIDRKSLNYLNWASLNTGESKSEIIRRVLSKEINKSDSGF